MGLLVTDKLLRKPSHRQAQRCVSYVPLNPLKWTTKTDHRKRKPRAQGTHWHEPQKAYQNTPHTEISAVDKQKMVEWLVVSDLIWTLKLHFSHGPLNLILFSGYFPQPNTVSKLP